MSLSILTASPARLTVLRHLQIIGKEVRMVRMVLIHVQCSTAPRIPRTTMPRMDIEAVAAARRIPPTRQALVEADIINRMEGMEAVVLTQLNHIKLVVAVVEDHTAHLTEGEHPAVVVSSRL